MQSGGMRGGIPSRTLLGTAIFLGAGVVDMPGGFSLGIICLFDPRLIGHDWNAKKKRIAAEKDFKGKSNGLLNSPCLYNVLPGVYSLLSPSFAHVHYPETVDWRLEWL